MKNKLLLVISVLLYLLIIGDCISTYYCLTTPTLTYEVREGNPATAWLFQQVGLVTGLWLLLVVKAVGLVYLSAISKHCRVRYWTVLVGMVGAILVTGYVNYNNWSVYYHILHS